MNSGIRDLCPDVGAPYSEVESGMNYTDHPL